MKIKNAQKTRYTTTVLCLTVIGVFLNVTGSFMRERFGISFIPSNLGTILASLFGGTVPGVMSAFFSSAICRLFDPDAIYFGVVNVIAALFVSLFRSRRAFRRVHTGLAAMIGVWVVQFVPDMLISWLLGGYGGSRLASASERFLDAGAPGEYAAHLFAFAFVNFCSILIVFGVSLIVLTLFPSKARERIWLTMHPETEGAKLNVRRSLSRKVIAIVLTVEILFGALAYALGFFLYDAAAMRNYQSICDSVTKVMSLDLDPDKIDDFIALGRDDPDYVATEAKLARIKESFPMAEYVYVYRIEEDGCRVVFDLDPEGSTPGDLIPFDESFYPLLPTLKAGGEIDPIVSDDTYGYLLTVYTPVKNAGGECVCYACADINMEDVITDESMFLVKLMSSFLGVSLVIMCMVVDAVRRSVVDPLNKMALAAGDFAFDEDAKRSESLKRLEELDLKSNDELGNLYASLTKMAHDSAGYIDKVETQSRLISKMQQEIIVDFADMVEARDKCTGDHIKNTSAYVEAIAKELQAQNAFDGQMTDDFIARLVRSAPLHDVGKIKISDIILNKPGKLTDDEFALMKTHTVEGREILTHSSSLANESGYLDQAIEMANYHHERWDGKGYPTGAAGEQIPISARIMAVADVFDALVSQRSYKKPFSFEEAMQIINNDSGSHFDPTVVGAFNKIARQVYDRMMSEKGTDDAPDVGDKKD